MPTTTATPTRSVTELVTRATSMYNAVKADPDVALAVVGMAKLLVALAETVAELEQRVLALDDQAVIHVDCAKCDRCGGEDVYHHRGHELVVHGEPSDFADLISAEEAARRGLTPCTICFGGS